jgi:hypothetical protein
LLLYWLLCVCVLVDWVIRTERLINLLHSFSNSLQVRENLGFYWFSLS